MKYNIKKVKTECELKNKDYNFFIKNLKKKELKKEIEISKEFCEFHDEILKISNLNFDINIHQLIPTFDLESKNKQGLLVNHYMGLGKTITGLIFASYYTYRYKKKLILLIPDFLKSTWISEIKLRNFNIDISNIIFITFENFKQDIKNLLIKFKKAKQKKSFGKKYCLIVDESHKLTGLLLNLFEKKDKDFENYYNLLQKIDKKLFLTGTPFYNSIYDIAFQINLVSGEDLLPVTEIKFNNEYKKVSILKSGFFGWIIPIIKSSMVVQLLTTLLTTAMLVTSITNLAAIGGNDFRIDAQSNTADELEKTVEKINKETEVYGLNVTGDETDKIQDLRDSNIEIEKQNETLKKSTSLKYMNSFYKLFGLTFGTATLSTPMGQFVALVPIIMVITTYLIGIFYNRYDLDKIVEMNHKKIVNKIFKYYCYFRIDSLGVAIRNKCNSCLKLKNIVCGEEITGFKGIIQRYRCRNFTKDLEKRDFPDYNFFIKKTPYTNYQTNMFLEMSLNKLTDYDIKKLSIEDDYHAKFIDIKKDKDFYRVHGMKISNLFIKKGEENISNNKNLINEELMEKSNEIQKEIENTMKDEELDVNKKIEIIDNLVDESNKLLKENTNILDQKNIKKKKFKFLNKKKLVEYPIKFTKILKISEGNRTVIYSNYVKTGIEYFISFLDEINLERKEKKKQITYYFITPEIKEDLQLFNNIIAKYRNNEINFLLLHPTLIEGLNIIETQNFHFLEPVKEYNKLQQIVARSIRYQSHHHLPIEDRFVNIYMWVNTTFPKLKNFFSKFSYWKKYGMETVYWKRFHSFDQDITPDYITYKLLKRDEKHIKVIEKYIRNKNIILDYKHLLQ